MSAPHGPLDFEQLLGKWSFSRRVDDRRAGQAIDVLGVARIGPSDVGLIYDEAATMHLPGQVPLQSTRRYRIEDHTDHAAFYFEDGRYFHRLDLGRREARCHHECPPDSYDVVYDFSAWPQWTARWTVRGPRKDYVMTTTYCPVGRD